MFQIKVFALLPCLRLELTSLTASMFQIKVSALLPCLRVHVSHRDYVSDRGISAVPVFKTGANVSKPCPCFRSR